ncbi:plasmid partitioning protein RepB [Palleronia sp.]|uniref:plasmid partitioning protein RepB n=1 Tax=Palleronia sp. TaxID=1940284 RepID=UPI0035C85862
MARKNIFRTGIGAALDQDPDREDLPSPAAEEEGDAPFGFGPVQAMRSNFRDIANRTIREIDPEHIEAHGLRDRLAIDDADIVALRESIREHGQQVPILVRPHPKNPDRYQIVYGRRRLAAMRDLGVPIKALVRTLDDLEAIVAQGQENSQRKDPSFVEKAVFANAMKEEGYPTETITSALSIDRSGLSRMLLVSQTLPLPLIEAIGSAHGSGRRPWTELADLLRLNDLDPMATFETVLPEGFDPETSSDDRLILFRDKVSAHLTGGATGDTAGGVPESGFAPDVQEDPASPVEAEPNAVSPAPRPKPGPVNVARKLALRDGRPVAELKRVKKGVTLTIPDSEHPEFSTWFDANAETVLRKVYRDWLEESGSE